MKNSLIIVLCVMIFIFLAVTGLLISRNSDNQKKIAENNEFYVYIGKIITGGDVTTIINKAINKNEKNKIPKDENGHYFENNENSIKMVIMINNQEYAMEDIYNNDTLRFIQSFNSINFKCTNIEYHKETGNIKRITVEQIINF